jgi:ribonucleoside-diphosphate reductase alpha chain
MPKAPPTPGFDVESFRQAVATTIIGQEIIVGNAKYPTDRIRDNSHRFRPLGSARQPGRAADVARPAYDSAQARAARARSRRS